MHFFVFFAYICASEVSYKVNVVPWTESATQHRIWVFSWDCQELPRSHKAAPSPWHCRAPGKQHLYGTGIKAHLRLSAWPSTLRGFWGLKVKISFVTFKRLKPNVACFLCLLCLGHGGGKKGLQLQIKMSYRLNMTSSRSFTHQFQSNFPNISSRHWTRHLVK